MNKQWFDIKKRFNSHFNFSFIKSAGVLIDNEQISWKKGVQVRPYYERNTIEAVIVISSFRWKKKLIDDDSNYSVQTYFSR